MGVFAVILVCSIGGVLLLALWVVAGYEGLLRAHTQIEEAWSRIEVQLDRRHEVIPALLGIVRAFAGHEGDAIERLDRACLLAAKCEDLGQKADAERKVDESMQRLEAVVKDCCDLLSSESWRQIHEELDTIESELTDARQHYNTQVAEYDAGIKCIPTCFIARLFRFSQESYFELEYEAEQVDASQTEQLVSVGLQDRS